MLYEDKGCQAAEVENELITLTQGDLTVSQFFDKVKLLSEKITKLDPLHPIDATRMRRIIIWGLRHEFNPIIAGTR